MSKSKSKGNVRDTITGQYVRPNQAKIRPHTTVTEARKKRKK